MNNVVALTTARGLQQLLDAGSPIMFKAYERPLFYKGGSGREYDNTGHKALVRLDERDQPVCLNVVKDTYKVIQNAELFDAVERGLSDVVGQTPQIVDKIAHGGRLCYRQYIYKDINYASPEHDKIVFRVVTQNGFGGSAIKLHVGAIDMFCTNGMILGDYESMYAKHTSGVKLIKFEELVRMAVTVFWNSKDMWDNLRSHVLKDDDIVFTWLKENFGERLGTKLFHHYLIEQRTRGGKNMWALYSTLTYYSSHAEGDFSLRQTSNDHAAATMLGREQTVRKVLQSGQLEQLRIAA